MSECLGVQLSGFSVVWVSGGLPGGPGFGSFNDQNVRSSKKSISVQFSRYKIRQFTIYYAGSPGQWDKRIVDQASDVPSIIFFS